MSGCGWADGTSHGEVAIGRGTDCLRREVISVFGPVKSWVPVEHYDLLRGFIRPQPYSLTYSLPSRPCDFIFHLISC